MISTIHTRDEFQYEIKYPKLVYYSYETNKLFPEIIALVNDNGHGVILMSNNITHYKVGEFIQDGNNTNYWSDYLGNLLLTNEVEKLRLNKDKFNEII